MKNTPFSSYLRRQQGATLMVMVLLTMLILLAVLFVTMSLSMGARRTTTDQRQTIPAQFAAESGMAAATATLASANLLTAAGSSVNSNDVLLKDANGLPIKDAAGEDKPDVNYKSPLQKVGIDLTFQEAVNEIGKMCNGNATNLSNVNITETNLTYAGATLAGYAEVCKLSGDSFTPEQASLFYTLLSDKRTDVVKTFKGKGLSLSAEDKQLFLDTIFNNKVTKKIDDNSSYTIQGGFRPLAIIRKKPKTDAQTAKGLTTYPYALVFQITDITSTGNNALSERRIVMGNNSPVYALRTDLQFFGVVGSETKKPNFNQFVYFVNEAKSAWWSSKERIVGGGRMHTNTFFQVESGFTLDSQLSSAGCTTMKDGAKDDKTGLYARVCKDALGTHPYLNHVSSTGKVIAKVSSSQMKDLGVNPNEPGYNYYGSGTASNKLNINMNLNRPTNKINLNEKFIPLPTNATDQQDLATKQGIYVNQTIDRLQLSVETQNGVKYQQIDTLITGSSGSELYQLRHPAPDATGKVEMQIRICKGAKNALPTNCTQWQYAKKGGGAIGWESDSNPGPDDFNGVIYSSKTITSLTGPERSKTNAAAIADFSNITVTANGQQDNSRADYSIDENKAIGITGDLKLENRSGKGVLGIYTVKGHVFLYNTGTSTQNTNPYSTSLNPPDNVVIDAYMMSSGGSFRVIPDNLGKRGKIDILGGLVANHYTLTGLAGSNGSTTGYVFDIKYDNRGFTPNGFPTYGEPITTNTIAAGNTKLVGVDMGYLDPKSTTTTTAISPTFNAGEIRQVGIK